MLRNLMPSSLFGSFFLIITLMTPAISTGEILTIDEDFSTTARRDDVMTTAVWDTLTMQVHLHSQILFARGTLNTNSAYWSVLSGDHLFLADGISGLRSINVADPDLPVLSGLMGCTDQAKSVAVAGDHAYVAAGSAGLQVIDISDPLNMLDGGYFDNEGDLAYVSTVAIFGETLFLAESGSGVAVFDISDPAIPVFVQHMGTGSWVKDVFTSDTHLFVIDNEMKIFDLSTPLAPSQLSSTALAGTALRVTSQGGRAFVAMASSGLEIFDVSNLETPQSIGLIDDDWDSCKFATSTASGDTVFVATGNQGLYILDATDPAEIITLGNFDTINSAQHIVHADGLIHLCASGDGLKIFQINPSGLDPLRNRAQTINLNENDDPVSRIRLSAAVSDSVSFQVTADGGSIWHDIESGVEWFELPTAGSDVRWRANLHQTDSSPAGGPICGSVSLSMDRLASYAEIISVSDVPGESGLQVRLSWNASRHDTDGGEHSVTEYSIYRRYEGAMAASSDPGLAYPPGQWDFVTTIPADYENQYAAVVPTLADSNHAGIPWAVYFVRTRTTQTGVFFDSPPDSGYSVNNLQPSPPTGLVVDYSPPAGTQLNWNPTTEPRFAHFRIYRSSQPNVPVQPATLHAITTDTEYFDDTTEQYFYQLTQMTFDGQESDPALYGLTPVSKMTPALHLLPNSPNPFNPLTKISFLVGGSQDPVSLVIFDTRGLKVRQLLAEPLPEGWHTATWNGRDDAGRACASGLYHARLRQGPLRRVMKMTLVR